MRQLIALCVLPLSSKPQSTARHARVRRQALQRAQELGDKIFQK